MTGRDIPAREAERHGLVNMVIPDDEVDAKALEIATQTAANSPDSVLLSLYGALRACVHVLTLGLRLTERMAGYQRMMDEFFASREYALTVKGENYKEGLRAFVEKREPQWLPSKL